NQHLGHSLDDPQNYLENRLGKAVMEQINRGQIDIEVYAGSAERFAVSGDVTSGSIREVPSLYSEWGIRKFLVHRKGKKPLLTFVIPPIKEYAEHYAYMFDLAGSKNTKVVVNQVDRRIMRANFKKGARSIMKEFDHPIDVVAMGYGDHIEEALLKSDGEYKILDQKIIKGAEGWVDAKILTLERKNGEILTMLSGGSNKTLWGEASEAMAEAFLEYNPKLFFFMGSAGAPFGTTDIYNVSVPQKFMIGKQELGIENVIYKNRSLAEGQIEDIRKSVRVIFGGTHGHTSSPAQQSISYVDSLGKLKINSIDVEQSLVARAVKIHNLKALQKKKYNHNHVLFGAINLITDKPRHSKSLGAHAHNLDNVDQGLKHISRLSILDIMFETVRQESEIGKVRHKSCQGLIFGLLPGL
ncbi:MAG: hypothetical protein HOM21_08665, partial [Halobacteriovoraceae bacterium]|nr:hypothetical protein [Halobacteriovoraceae bacterium]